MQVRREKTTVIFVGNSQQSTPSIQIPTGYIRHWKKYLMGLLSSFALLISLIAYLSYSKVSADLSNDKLGRELIKSKQESRALDTSAVKKYYLSIDKKLLRINKYLRARGIKPIVDDEGGEQSTDILSPEEIGEFYDGSLNKMINYVAFTPMGYPHEGAITSGYGHRENPFTGENVETHKGLDIRGNYGDNVISTASGKVIFAGPRGGYGNCIIISHGYGYETYYGHLSKILIKQGQQIEAGDMIGKVGSTGRSTGPHLHYEVHKDNKIINPRSFLTLE